MCTTDRQTDRLKANRKTDRLTDRLTDRQTEVPGRHLWLTTQLMLDWHMLVHE